jgi:putative ABC transport system substrate-binding protein
MKRREFLASIVWTAATLRPLRANAQQPGRMRRVAVVSGASENDPDSQARFAVFRQALQQFGWSEGSNFQIDLRWRLSSADAVRNYVTQWATHAPDVILVVGGTTLELLLQATRAVPLVFVIVPDPVGSGFVESWSRPGGNVTGFAQFEYSLCAKWPELLKQISPETKRVAVLRDPTVTAGIGQFAVIQAAAPAVGVEVLPVSVRDAGEIERGIAAFARSADGGLILTASASGAFHRELVIALAARHKLPALYTSRDYVTAGGLISYGANLADQFRRVAGYVDRILKGEKPADLPVQAPAIYELAINLKTANALGLTVPQSLLARADEVIE